MTACKILGDADGFRKAQASFEKLAVNLTNRWTKALAALCLSVMSCDAEGIAPGREFLPESSAGESKAQAELRAEYEYYLDNYGLVVIPHAQKERKLLVIR